MDSGLDANVSISGSTKIGFGPATSILIPRRSNALPPPDIHFVERLKSDIFFKWSHPDADSLSSFSLLWCKGSADEPLCSVSQLNIVLCASHFLRI
jgi:hypothetical protein